MRSPTTPHTDGDHGADGTLNAYRHLAGKGAQTPEQLATGLGLTGDEVRTLVAELVRLRLGRRTDAGAVFAVPGSQAVDDLLDEQELQLSQVVERVNEGRRGLRTLVDNQSLLDPAEAARITSTVLGKDVPSGMFELPGEARDGLAAMHPGGAFEPDLLNRSLARAAQALERGVRMRVIHQSSALRHPPTVSYLNEFTALGGRVRLRDNLPFRMLLIDDSTAVCSLPASGSYLLRGERVLALLNRFFETSWIDAVPLGGNALQNGRQPLGTGPTSAAHLLARLTPVHEGILRQLAEGQTDGSIARSAGITPRTVTRRISEIYAVLGVKSRFQAGIVAKELGIV